MKNTIYMMIGLPGSGKSTYAEHFNLPIVSLDDIREEFHGDASNQADGLEVYLEGMRRIHETLARGSSVVYDATNLYAKDRKRFIRRFKDVNIIAVYMATPLEDCLARNAARDRVVPERVIQKMAAKFNPPSKEEGFYNIYLPPCP